MHHHSVLLIWAFYFLGQMLSVLSHAQASKRSALNGIVSYRHYFSVHGVAIAWRLFLETMGFGMIAYMPPSFAAWLSAKSFSWVGDLLTMQMNPFLAGMIGLMVDMGLDRLVGILHWQKEIPPVNNSNSSESVKFLPAIPRPLPPPPPPPPPKSQPPTGQ
jgi:hypothetical protein